MFANTLTVKIGTDADRVLTRVNQDNYGSVYRLATDLEITELYIRNSVANEKGFPTDRHNAELRHTVYATDVAPERVYVASNTFKTRRAGGNPSYLSDVTKAVNSLVSTSLVAGMVQGES